MGAMKILRSQLRDKIIEKYKTIKNRRFLSQEIAKEFLNREPTEKEIQRFYSVILHITREIAEGVNISFGVEYEANFLSENLNKITQHTPNRYAHINKWDYQQDGTAGTEIRTPIFTDINQFSQESQEQWQHWMSQNPNVIPQFKCNYYHSSIGHHIHIGLPTRQLQSNEKLAIVRKTLKLMPLLAFISANQKGKVRTTSYLSKRMVVSSFCRNGEMMTGSHYDEISDSRHGTVEFRLFDANFPQINTTIITILKILAEKGLTEKTGEADTELYKREKMKILSQGLSAYDVMKYRELFLQEIGDLDFTKYPACVKEILYLILVYGYNPSEFIGGYNVKISKAMLSDTSTFFANLQNTIRDREKREELTNMIRETENITKFSEIIGRKIIVFDKKRLANGVRHLLEMGKTLDEITGLLNEKFEVNKRHLNKIIELLTVKNPKSNVKEMRELFQFNPNLKGKLLEDSIEIKRLNECGNKNNVATEVSSIIGALEPVQIVQSPVRFYVALAGNKVLGTIGIYAKTKTLYVMGVKNDIPDYQKIKVTKILLNYAERLGVINLDKQNLLNNPSFYQEYREVV